MGEGDGGRGEADGAPSATSNLWVGSSWLERVATPSCEELKVLVASLTPYTVVVTPFPTWASSRFREDLLAEDRKESVRLRDLRDDRSSLAALRECGSLRVLEWS